MENRVLPPIEIPSRSPKSKTNNVNNVPTSRAGAKTITNDNNVLPNAQTLLQILEHRSCKPNCNSNISRSRSSSLDLQAKDNNESNANNCICEKSDNNLNIGKSSAINSNIETTTNRCNGQPELPTLSTDTKMAISTNCK